MTGRPGWRKWTKYRRPGLPGVPWLLRLSEWLGIRVLQDAHDSTSHRAQWSIGAHCFGQKLSINVLVVIGQFLVAVPCALVSEAVFAGDKGAVLFDSGGVTDEALSQQFGYIGPSRVAQVVRSRCLDSSQCDCEGCSDFDRRGALRISSMDVEKQKAAEDCGKQGGDGWGEWWQWIVAALLPLAMFVADGALKRPDSDA